MSRSGNTNLLAKKIRSQTSLKLSTASRLAQQVHTYLGPPIPDAEDQPQRRLEAYCAHVLARRFQDGQLNGALLGVVEARPTARQLELVLEPAMADSVIYELLPRFDKHYGGIRGVPGLRPRRRQGQLVLRDSFGPAHLIASRADRKPLHLPAPRDGETRLWKARGRLSRDEKREAREWDTSIPHIVDAPVRDVLLSRILRRPALVNRAAQPHGFANCYTHHEGDLVIEWCCGDTVEAFCATLLAHDFAQGLPRDEAIKLLSAHMARLGGHTLILRRHPSCQYGKGPFSAQEIAEHIREGYAL
ncbi:hypothetical protein [Streptomyces hokutonensis]|uniref:Uncharacterized protein n=1 Tax=Streptomyces hokutonensis TaxID=1306990 RepID=A0ABW6MG75_9ACTN